MARASSTERRGKGVQKQGGQRASHELVARLIAGMLAVAIASPAVAQSSAATGNLSPPSACRIVNAPATDGSKRFAYVVCGNAGASLGRVEGAQISPIPALRAAVVITEVAGSRRVWLAMDNGDRSLLLEEITNTIARAAGRGARADLSGIELDFDDLAKGRLTGAVMSSGSNGSAKSVDIGRLIERARAVRQASPRANNGK